MTEKVKFFTADGLYIRQIMVAEIGSLIPQHAHAWDHTTMVAAGAVRAWKDGRMLGEFEAPAGIFIEKGAKHSFLTLAPDTILYCLHNLHGKDAVEILAEHEFTPQEVDALMADRRSV